MAKRDFPRRTRPKTYTDDFKCDAVRLVTEQKYSIAAAAKAVGVSDPTIRQWMAKFAPPIPDCGPEATIDELRDENKRLKAALKRAELEREIPKKVTAFFALNTERRLIRLRRPVAFWANSGIRRCAWK